jgi:hypothetical protein
MPRCGARAAFGQPEHRQAAGGEVGGGDAPPVRGSGQALFDAAVLDAAGNVWIRLDEGISPHRGWMDAFRD